MPNSELTQKHLEVLRLICIALIQKPRSEKQRAVSLIEALRTSEAPTSLLPEITSLVQSSDWERAERLSESAKTEQTQVFTLFDQAYPKAFSKLIDPPFAIFVRGTLPVNPGVAIVGSRKSTEYGRSFAYALSDRLARAGIPVISGLARGIDAEAHKACVARKLPCVAVLGSGVHRVYPPEHYRLAEEILSNGGCIISEYGLLTEPRDYFFPERNRLVVALSKAVIVVEAELRSGALITARLGAEQGKDVFALPGSILSPTSGGTNYLLKSGALPITGIEDLFGLWPELSKECANTSTRSKPEFSHETRTLLEMIDYQVAKPFDLLVELSGHSAGEAAQLLTLLELEGQISRLPGALFLRNQTVDIK